jgi:hypothetical protein
MQGTIDNKNIGHIFDAIAMISTSGAWTVEDEERMQLWAAEYLKYMLSDHTAQERSAVNNHGIYYDLQLLSLLQYLRRYAQCHGSEAVVQSACGVHATCIGVPWHLEETFRMHGSNVFVLAAQLRSVADLLVSFLD